jgi:hypothetical protein
MLRHISRDHQKPGIGFFRLEVLMTELDRYLSAVERPSTERAKHVGPGYGPEWVAENRHGW